jgi:predicted dehydrogenase
MSSATARLRIGAIGLGRWGDHLADAIRRSGSGELVRCYSPSPDSRERFAARHGCRPALSLDDLLEDPEVDAVVIATPHSTHVPLVVAAANAGKDVFVEKPLSLTVSGGERAIAAAESAGVVLQVADHRSRQAGVRRIRQWVESGELGVLQLLEANFSTNVSVDPAATWKHSPVERPLGGMTTLGLHILEHFVRLAGMPSRVATMSKRVLGRADVDDITTLMLDFADGPLGSLASGLAMPKLERLAVHGSAGSAWNEVDIAPGAAQPTADRLYRQGVEDLQPTELPNEPADTLAEQMTGFAAAVRRERSPENGGTEALRMVTLVAAALESKRSGLPVDLARFDPGAAPNGEVHEAAL